MIVPHDRERIINAIIYFAKNTKHCHTLKLFKLLNAADFEHYRQRGRTITGLMYQAWENGPVPPALFKEFRSGGAPDLKAALVINTIVDDITNKTKRRDLIARKVFESKYFSKRELEIMKHVAEVFLEAPGGTMSEFSHSRNLPWKKVWGSGEGKGKEINPDLSLSSDPLISDRKAIDREELEFRRAI